MLLLAQSGAKAVAIHPRDAYLNRALELIIERNLAADPDSALVELLGVLRALDLPLPERLAWLFERVSPAGNVPKSLRDALLENDLAARALRRLDDLQDEVDFLVRRDPDRLYRLSTLDDLRGEKPAEISFDESRSVSHEGGDFGLVLDVNVGARLGLRVLDAAAAEVQFGTRPRGLALAVEAGLAGGGTLGLRYAALAASGSGQLAWGAALVYDYPATTSVVRALRDIARDVPDALTLKGLVDAIDEPRADGLRQWRVSLERGFEFALSAGVKAGSVLLRNVSVADEKMPIRTEAKAALDLSLSVSENASRTITVSKDDAGYLWLRASREFGETVEGKLTAGFDVRIKGWDKAAVHLLGSALPDATPLIEKLGPLAQPGDWLKEQLTDALPDSLVSLAPALVGDMKPKAIAGELRRLIAEAVDTRVDLWGAALEGRADALADRIVSGLLGDIAYAALAKELRDWLEPQLQAKLGDAVTALQDRLRSELKGKSAAATDKAVDELAELLARLGRPVAKAASGVQSLVQPALQFLSDYASLRSKLISAAEEKLKLQLTVALSHSYRREHRARLDLDWGLPLAALTSIPKQAESDFRRWLFGRDPENAERPFGLDAATVRTDWLVSSSTLRTIQTGLKIDIGFSNVDARTLLKTDTRVDIGPGGVLMLRTRTESQKTHKRRVEQFTVAARALFDALAAPVDLALGQFSLDVALKDPHLKRSELDALLASLEHTGDALLSPDSREAAIASWEALAAAQGKVPSAKLHLAITMTPAARQRLYDRIKLGEDSIKRDIIRALLDAGRRRTGRQLEDALSYHYLDGDPVEEILAHWDALWQQFNVRSRAAFNGRSIDMRRRDYLSETFGLPIRRFIVPARSLHDALTAMDWPRLNGEMADVTRAFQETSDYKKAKTPADAALLLARHLDETYDQRAAEFAKDLGRALAASDEYFDKSDDVPVNTLGMMLLLHRVAGVEVEVGLTAL